MTASANVPRTFGTIDPAVLKELDGLTLLRRIADGTLPAPTMAETMNFTMDMIETGHVVFHGTPKPGFFNPLGTVHGGWYATLLDSCMGCAIHTLLPKGVGYTTIEIKTNFVRSMGLEDGPAMAEGKVTHPGRRIALAEGRITDAKGRLIATGTTSCLIFSP